MFIQNLARCISQVFYVLFAPNGIIKISVKILKYALKEVSLQKKYSWKVTGAA